MTRPTRLALPIVIVVATVTAAVGEELTPTEGLAPAEELAPIDVELTTGPQRPPPISVFTGASEVGGITISPSGRYLTAAIRQGDEAEFQIIKDPERETTVNIGLGTEREVIQVVWLSDELALFRQSKRVLGRDYKSTTGEFATIHAETGHIQRAGAGALIDILPDQPDHVLIQGGSDRFAEAYRVDIRSRRPMKVARSAAPQGSFVPNAEGEILVSIGVNTDNEQEIHTRESTSGRWNLVATYGLDDEGWLPVHAGPRAKTYYTYDSRGGSTAGLGLYDAAANTHRMLLRHPDVDVSSLLYDHAGRNAYAVRFDHHYPQVMYLIKNHPLARMHASLQQKYPDDTVSLVSMTRDNQKAIALITSDRKPGDYFLVDVAAQKIEHLKSRKPQLKPEMLSPVSPIELQTRDDETIYGYVTSSPSAEKPGPMIVYVHGGPHGIRDYWGYDDTVQLFASRGFHVLQVNYRGSGGYGVDYQQKGFGEWGRLMQDDVTDATRWAIQTGIADPDRICIHGVSYGAYSALVGVVRDPDLYRCAVGMSGIYDLTIMESRGDIGRSRAGERFLQRVLGADRETLIATSPAHQARDIRAKVMLIHGGIDDRAPPDHAHRMRDALIKAGNPPEWLFDREQGHSFLGNETRRSLYERMLAFLEAHSGET